MFESSYVRVRIWALLEGMHKQRQQTILVLARVVQNTGLLSCKTLQKKSASVTARLHEGKYTAKWNICQETHHSNQLMWNVNK